MVIVAEIKITRASIFSNNKVGNNFFRFSVEENLLFFFFVVCMLELSIFSAFHLLVAVGTQKTIKISILLLTVHGVRKLGRRETRGGPSSHMKVKDG